MVVILVHRHVPILDNGGTGLIDPWSYQVDTLVLSMDLTADRTWDQLCNTKSDVLLTWVLTDPWSIVINVNDHLRNGPGISD
jgi:hypothetical protein